MNNDNQKKKIKILIAEDEEFSNIYLSEVVKKISSEIFHAKSGTTTVEICKNNPDIDLILMDIRMPEMDGYEATLEIRKFNKDVIIIAQTAYGLDRDMDKAIEVGCNNYIAKPIGKSKLLEMIGKYFTI
jgi:CheY-like chemotaxis protein